MCSVEAAAAASKEINWIFFIKALIKHEEMCRSIELAGWLAIAGTPAPIVAVTS